LNSSEASAGSRLLQHPPGLVEPSADGVPAGRVRQEEHAHEQRDGRDGGDASIHRQTCGSLISDRGAAFMAKARNCPVTIISSLMVTMRPRRCAGAISARNSGHVADAAPTPNPG
jgi:hypothetical protein